MNKKLKKIKLLAMDVDGVLTDGKIVIDDDGRETKIFNVQDGFGIVIFQKAGFKTAIITARSAKAVDARAADLKIDKTYQNAYPKIHVYERMLQDFGLRDEEVCYMGDDLPDLQILRRAGFGVSVPNAVSEAKYAADYVTKKHGGRGAVREVIELILKAQGKWKKIVAQMAVILIVLFFPFVVSAQQGAQQFEGFNLQGYTDGGQKAWDVKGTTANIQGNTVEISNVDANRYGEQNVNLKARKGQIDRTSGQIHLEDDVVITAQNGAQLKTESLDWEKEKDLVATDDPVTITGQGMVANGTGLKAQPGLKTAQLDKDVTVQVNTEPENPASDTVTITCDGPMELDQKNHRAVFNENVVAVQKDRTLKADKVELYFNPETQKIKEMVCLGHVEISQQGNQTFAEKAVYNGADEKMTLYGRPKLIMETQGGGGGNPFGAMSSGE